MLSHAEYFAITEKLVRAASRDIQKGLKHFERYMPQVAAQIRQDAVAKGPLSFWGRSHNFDEIAQATIVEPCIVELIALLAGRRMSTVSPHAGLLHTYGYLFSVLETPYGFKRERWLETDIEDAFGLDASTLSPSPLSGTLLSNATWLAGLFAFRSHAAAMFCMREYLAGKVADDLLRLDAGRLSHVRFTETVSVNWYSRRRRFRLQTDLVQFPNAVSRYLLIYSVDDCTSGRQSLVTMFPASDALYELLQDRAEVGRQADIRLRYNAWVPCLNGKVLTGQCRWKVF
jgi:hypothetical protein